MFPLEPKSFTVKSGEEGDSRSEPRTVSSNGPMLVRGSPAGTDGNIVRRSKCNKWFHEECISATSQIVLFSASIFSCMNRVFRLIVDLSAVHHNHSALHASLTLLGELTFLYIYNLCFRVFLEEG